MVMTMPRFNAKELLVLRDMYEGKSIREIADIHSMPLKTAYNIVTRLKLKTNSENHFALGVWAKEYFDNEKTT